MTNSNDLSDYYQTCSEEILNLLIQYGADVMYSINHFHFKLISNETKNSFNIRCCSKTGFAAIQHTHTHFVLKLMLERHMTLDVTGWTSHYTKCDL